MLCLLGRHWAACFIRDIGATVIETIVAPKPISYHNILQLDAKIRAFPEYYPERELFKDMNEMGIGEHLQRCSFGMMRHSSKHKEISSIFVDVKRWLFSSIALVTSTLLGAGSQGLSQ